MNWLHKHTAHGECRVASRTLACFCAGVGILAMAAIACAAVPDLDTAPFGDNPSEPILKIKGKTATAEELTSFSLIVRNYERQNLRPAEIINEYVLTQAFDTVLTTGSEVNKEIRAVASKYPYVSQRSLLRAALNDRLRTDITVTTPTMESWLKERQANFTTPESATARHIFMEVSSTVETSSPAAVRARMEKVKADADKGTSFGLLAKQYSESASGAEGGLIGTVKAGQPFGAMNKPINPKLEAALMKLKPGQVSDIIQTSAGLHLIYSVDYTTTHAQTVTELVKSGVLPDRARVQLLTDKNEKLRKEAREKHRAEIAATTGTAIEITTTSPALRVDGKTLTFRDYEKMYGPSFTRAFGSAQRDPAGLDSILKQMLDIESDVLVAVDLGVDKQPDVARDLALAARRADFLAAAAARNAENAIGEEEVKAAYERDKDQFRQPEVEGFVISFKAPETTDPALLKAGQEKARKAAESAYEQVKSGLDISKVLTEVEGAADLQTTGGEVSRHIANQGVGLERDMDMLIAGLEEGQLGTPRELPGFRAGFAKITKRYPGNPAPLEQVRRAVVNRLQSNQTRKNREDLLSKLDASGIVEYLPAAQKIRAELKDAESTAPKAIKQ